MRCTNNIVIVYSTGKIINGQHPDSQKSNSRGMVVLKFEDFRFFQNSSGFSEIKNDTYSIRFPKPFVLHLPNEHCLLALFFVSGILSHIPLPQVVSNRDFYFSMYESKQYIRIHVSKYLMKLKILQQTSNNTRIALLQV